MPAGAPKVVADRHRKSPDTFFVQLAFARVVRLELHIETIVIGDAIFRVRTGGMPANERISSSMISIFGAPASQHNSAPIKLRREPDRKCR